jgi:hypothetical protein
VSLVSRAFGSTFGALAGSFTSPVPSDVLGELEQLAAEFEALRNADSKRLERYRSHREEMDRGRDPARKIWTEDYGRKPRDDLSLQRHDIVLPFGQVLTVKHTYRVSGRLPDVYVDPRDAGALEQYRSMVMEKIIWGLLREANGEQQFASGAWDASQVGAACFDQYWDFSRQMPVFREIDPATVVVVPGFDNPHNFRRVYRFWQEPLATVKATYRDIDFRGLGSFATHASGTKEGTQEVCTIVQVCEPGQFDETGELIPGRTLRFILEAKIPLYEEPNGLPFCPYVVIPNLGPEREVWGVSDYEMVRDLCNYLPMLFSREADVIRMTAGGAYLDKGTGQPPDQIANFLRKGGVLPAKKDSDLVPVGGPEVPDFLPTHVQTALQYLQWLGFAPPAAWGDGSAGSGSDRGLQLQPQLELTALKQVNWASGLTRLFGQSLQMIERLQPPESKAVYRGQIARGGLYRNSPFTLIIEPDAIDDPDIEAITDDQELIGLAPRTPTDLFDGDYRVRFVYANRLDPDDPAFVTAEINKFAQGVQSLQTTLERLGCQSPEDEMRRIEREAEKMPWLRQGMIALIKAQLGVEGQGEGGGPPVDPTLGLEDALGMMLTKDGEALDTDASIEALPGDSGVGVPYGGA